MTAAETKLALNYAGCFIIILIVYPIILKTITKLPVIDFFRGIIDAQAVAFLTASSNAALPVTLRFWVFRKASPASLCPWARP